MALYSRLSDLREHPRLGMVGTIPLFPDLRSSRSRVPPFTTPGRSQAGMVRTLPAYAHAAFTRVPWAGDPVNLDIQQLPQALADLGLDMQVSIAPSTSSYSHPEAAGQSPESAEEAGARTIVFRRPSTTELNAGYTDADYIVATPTVVESPLHRRLPTSRTLFGGSNSASEISMKKAAGEAQLDTPMYGDASSTASDLIEGASQSVQTLFNKVKDINLSPEAKKSLGMVAAGLGALGAWKVGSKFLPAMLMRSAIADGVGGRAGSGLASPASEAVVQDALVYGASGNTHGREGFRAVYEVPMDFWRTLYALGDVYENTASQPHFGMLTGDPRPGVDEVSLFALRAPDVYLTVDGRIVHSPVPYAATVLAGGIFKKLKNAAKKVANVATTVVAKVASNPLVKTAATAMGMGGVLNAVQKGAEVASKLTSSKPEDDVAPDAVPSSESVETLAQGVQQAVAPVDVSGDGPTETTLPEATLDEIQSAVAQDLTRSATGSALPGSWRDFLDGKDVSPEAFSDALSSPGSPLAGKPVGGGRAAISIADKGKKAGLWLLKSIASLAGWTLVDSAIAPDADPYAAPAGATSTVQNMNKGQEVPGDKAKGSFWKAVKSTCKFLARSTGKIVKFCWNNPRATGVVVAVCAFLAVGSRNRKNREELYQAIFDTLGDLLTVIPDPERDDVDQILGARQWLSQHRDAIVSGAELSESEMVDYEHCIMIAGLGASAVKSTDPDNLTPAMKKLLKFIDEEQATLSSENKAIFDELCADAAVTVQNAASGATRSASSEDARAHAREALAASSADARDRNAEEGDETSRDADPDEARSADALADEFISDSNNSSLLQDAAMRGLMVDVSSMNDREATAARTSAIADFLRQSTDNSLTAAVAASVAGSLVAMLAAKGLAKGKDVAQEAIGRARSWWASNFGLGDRNDAVEVSDFSIGV